MNENREILAVDNLSAAYGRIEALRGDHPPANRFRDPEAPLRLGPF
jgi:hypothetical protein